MEVGRALGPVVAAARRRAHRVGDRHIDTAHLLHALAEADAGVRDALGPAPQVARVLAYLVQRTIGYGLRWQGSVEDSGALPLLGHGPPGPAAGCTGPRAVFPGYSPAAAVALERALARAAARGAGGVPTGVDLLIALAADDGCRAVEVLRRAGVDTRRLAAGADLR
ncbi:Clp protease N-terminal domain-containing protein [Streptomyces sp. NPDC000594]|uniref:Clp protease N-terminal domain-containing protein n=1 Tax=Streptomyces sp. NPDC000594 TaxID=3154261 RepID=UPI003328B667